MTNSSVRSDAAMSAILAATEWPKAEQTAGNIEAARQPTWCWRARRMHFPEHKADDVAAFSKFYAARSVLLCASVRRNFDKNPEQVALLFRALFPAALLVQSLIRGRPETDGYFAGTVRRHEPEVEFKLPQLRLTDA